MYLDETTTTAPKPKTKIRCLIADDHVLVRQGIRRLLQDERDVEIVGEAGDAAEALKGVIELRPDIVLMDIVYARVLFLRRNPRHPDRLSTNSSDFLTMHESQEYVMRDCRQALPGTCSRTRPPTNSPACFATCIAGENSSARKCWVDCWTTGSSVRKGRAIAPR